MARGQYDLPLNRARPVFGPQRPPPLQASRPARSPSRDRRLCQQDRPIVLVLSPSGSSISKTQLVALRTRVEPEASIQVVDNADAAVAALSGQPSAVIVLDNAISEPAFEPARPELLRYAQSGGRLITDLSQVNATLHPTTHYDLAHANDRHVEYKMKDRMSDLRAEHMVS